VRLTSYVKVVGTTTLNIVGYLASGQRFLWLEGRVHRGVFRNWIHGYRYAPGGYRRPTSQDEVVALVKSTRSLRVFGSGHSFNEGVVSDGVLVSLDEFAGLVSADIDSGQSIGVYARHKTQYDLVGLAFRRGRRLSAGRARRAPIRFCRNA